MAPLLSIENLKVVLKDFEKNKTGWILRGINLVLNEGERLALVGESGCGKSMTALSILNLLPQPPMELLEGNILFKDRNLTRLPEESWREIRGKEIGIVFQEPLTSLNPVMRVGEQIEEIIRIHSNASKVVARDRVFDLLNEVGLPDQIGRA